MRLIDHLYHKILTVFFQVRHRFVVTTLKLMTFRLTNLPADSSQKLTLQKRGYLLTAESGTTSPQERRSAQYELRKQRQRKAERAEFASFHSLHSSTGTLC
jgi:hypothetical protein